MKLRIRNGRAWIQATGVSLDKTWISGIRKGWKKIVGQLLGVTERNEGLDSLEALDNTLRYIALLQQDLFFGKGLYPFQQAKKPVSEQLKEKAPFNIQAKVSVFLETAQEALENGKRRIKFWMAVTNPNSTEYKLDNRNHVEQILKDDRFKGRSEKQSIAKFLNSQAPLEATEAAKKADAEISGKLLRALSSFVGKYPGMHIGIGTDRDFSIGKVKVIFQDVPTLHLKKLTPEQIEKVRSPLFAKRYAKELATAKSLLDRRKLDYLWYGNIFIKPKGTFGANPHGTQFGVGGWYDQGKDAVFIEMNPEGVHQLLIHELGHRYYYKYMSMADRLEFSSYFGQVPGVSDYGKTVSAEDFAEVFTWYVLGRKLTRDQLERFKKFLGRKRQRGASTLLAKGTGGLKGPFQKKGPGYEDAYYTMDVTKDRFIHFTTVEAAQAIAKSTKLLLKPPGVQHFGPVGVFAISLVWGWFVPKVQLTHIKSKKPLVAVVFTTDTVPDGAAHHEEVYWAKDVKLKDVQVVSRGKAIQLLKKVPFPLKDEDAYVLYR